jgi:methylase of polypeptide subunit release factors
LIERLGLPTSQPLRVFDIGCGTDITARQLARRTAWVFDGADLTVEALKRCTSGLDRLLDYDVPPVRLHVLRSLARLHDR